MTQAGPAGPSGDERVLLVATRNAHKVAELSRMMPGVELDSLPAGVELPPETGDSYAENALVKARAAVAAVRRPTIADDSGIEADALDGRPGIRSARFAGPDATDADNLARLRSLAPAGSGLRYVCVIAYVRPDGEERLFRGECQGLLAAEPRGLGGFGYDPVFLPLDEPAGRTMAELSPEEKDAISHRGAAARSLLAWLAATSQPPRRHGDVTGG